MNNNSNNTSNSNFFTSTTWGNNFTYTTNNNATNNNNPNDISNTQATSPSLVATKTVSRKLALHRSTDDHFYLHHSNSSVNNSYTSSSLSSLNHSTTESTLPIPSTSISTTTTTTAINTPAALAHALPSLVISQNTNLIERSKSPISSLAFTLQETVTLRGSSPLSNPPHSQHTLQIPPHESTSFLSHTRDQQHIHPLSTSLPPLSSIQQPVPKKLSAFSPETSLFVTLNHSTQDLPKIQRRLFPNSPGRRSLEEQSSVQKPGTSLRRTHSDFGGIPSKVRKHIPFDDDDDPLLRGSKRAMHSAESKDKISDRLPPVPVFSQQVESIKSASVKENLPANIVIMPAQDANVFTALPPKKKSSISREKLPSLLLKQIHSDDQSAATPPTTPTALSAEASGSSIDFSASDSNPEIEESASDDSIGVSTPKDGPELILPVLHYHRSIPYITPETVAGLLNGQMRQDWQLIIVDCRYDYEFNGGHIRGAINLKTPTEVENEYIRSPLDNRKVIIIFHCEFSSHRGPTLCGHLRKKDRQVNFDRYPELYYPQLYVLQGGFKNFFEFYPTLCDPSGYVPMHDPQFKEELKQQKLSLRNSGTKVKRSFSLGDISFKRLEQSHL